MKTAKEIPFEKRSLDAGEVGELLGVPRRYVLERLAKKAGFPKMANLAGQRPRWIAGDVMEWRESNQVARRVPRR